jgi:hypothetical protein
VEPIEASAAGVLLRSLELQLTVSSSTLQQPDEQSEHQRDVQAEDDHDVPAVEHGASLAVDLGQKKN